jgi:TusA-related sulfurtransferase
MKELDLRGEPCPVPLIKTLKALEKLDEGEILRVLVDMPCARENVPKHMAEEGHEVEVKDDEKEMEIIIRKRNGDNNLEKGS